MNTKKNSAKKAKIVADTDELRKIQDPITGFPDTHMMMPSIQEILEKIKHLGFIYISISDYSEIARNFGANIFDLIYKDLGEFLRGFSKEITSGGEFNFEVTRYGNAFLLLVFRKKIQEIISYKELNTIREKIKLLMSKKILSTYEKSLDAHFGYLIGCSILNYYGKIDLERLFNEGLENAIIDSAQEKGRDVFLEELVLHDVINKGLISAVYQPIVNIKEKKILGFEVLSRGIEADYKNPEVLFHLAYKHDLVLPLDRRCRENAFRIGKELQKDQLLFVNSEIESIFDIHYNMKKTMSEIEKNNLTPDRIIIELTEKAAIKDLMAFRQAIQTLKMMGFRIAIDDIGYAYSGLKKIVELNPDYIKIDMSLIRDIHKNIIKKSLLSSVANFAHEAKIDVIAEGVETEDELKVIQEIGITYVQGFYLCYPSDNLHELKDLDFKGKL